MHTLFRTEQLRQEHSKLQPLRLAKWIGYDAERFAALMAIFLGPDQRLIIEEHIDHGSAAFKSRGTKILKRLRQ